MKPGLVLSLPASLYHLDPCDTPSLSKSVAHVLCTQSPAHARQSHPKLNPAFIREEKDIFDLGTVAHAVLLEGQAAVEVIDAADWRTNAAKEARDAARAAGKTPMLYKHWQAVVEMTTAARKQLNAHHATPQPFTGGAPEVTVVWEDEGVLCRSRIDWLHDGNAFISDYKSTSASADRDRWSRAMYGFGADLQAYVHARAVEAVTGVRPTLRYVVQETYPPYALTVIEPCQDVLTIGRKKWEHARELWRGCLASGEWPGYSQRVEMAVLPAWEEARWLEREVRELEEAA